ncbi:MAG: alpha-galactosidase [Thermoguttaceae bacterium]|nr:alpha-galactosidase [Thermoguttaceae bacterium]MDW8080091.1 alpha-galactosidase [Thermoguttaceae bacterium]
MFRRTLDQSLNAKAVRVGAALVALWVGMGTLPGTTLSEPLPPCPQIDRIVNAISAASAEVPFSFMYGERSSREFLPQWASIRQEVRVNATTVRLVQTWQDPAKRLEVRWEAIRYEDFPVIEWTIFFRNMGSDSTEILQQVHAVDLSLSAEPAAEVVLHHHVGSEATASDYAPRQTPLPPGQKIELAPVGGRPSNGVWPYFNLAMEKRGVIFAVGWPGQWRASFARSETGAVELRAGQQFLRAKLLPGEEIRTPLVVLLFWEGDRLKSQNIWRRWMIAHNIPRPSGKLPSPMFLASSSRAYEEMIHANEENQKMHIDRYLQEKINIDYWWMDAGWYVQEYGWPHVGTWEVDRRRFPRGLRAISDYAHARGVKILVWFEPERVMPGTWLYENHPEWLLSTSGRTNLLADLRVWRSAKIGKPDPCVVLNTSTEERQMAGIAWPGQTVSFHPGGEGQFAVIRYIADEAGVHEVEATFTGLDRAPTTTEVLVLAKGELLFRGWLNLRGEGNSQTFDGKVALSPGDTVDFVVGWGNGTHICDTTGIVAQVVTPSGKVHDVAREFGTEANPAGRWSYGWVPGGEKPDLSKFILFDRPGTGSPPEPRLLNLGNPAARQWLTEHISRLIVDEGIDLYRQDFNIDPLPFWRANDEPDREGITENKYVQGFLWFWDELRRRFPAMLIDSCASGGRRNDLETMRRAVPLWRSDYAYEPIGHQCMTYGISLWLPYHGTGTVAFTGAPYYGSGWTPVEPYAFWSNAAPSLGCGVDIRVPNLDYDTLRRLCQSWRTFSRFYYGDFYPLTAYTQSPAEWMAWQFHMPEDQAGAVQVFRRQESTVDEVKLRLRDIDPQSNYKITALEGQMPSKLTGRQLAEEGFAVRIPTRPGVVVFVYERE